jgi:DIS3-like exonuclease 2
VVEGAFRVNAHRRTEAYATVTGISVDLLVEDSAAQNRAFDGDTVVLQIYPEEKWKNVHQDSSVEPEIKGDEATNHNHDSESEDIETPAATPQKQSGAELAVAQLSDSLAKQLTFSSASTDPNETNEQRNAQGPLEFLTLKETLDILAKNNGERRPTARVVAISEALHRTKQFVGFLQATKKEQGPSASDKMAILVPFDKRQPKIFIPMNECPHDWIANHKNHVSTLYACEFRKWAYDMIYPIGRMVGPMGACGDLQAETVALLAENGIDDSGFPEAVLKGLPTSFQISQADLKARRDLRKECIFSIDPPTAKDLDDALSIVPVRDASGRVREFTVGVHIADVSHYVKENTALDKLAQTRSTSTYLIQRCIPMLPPILSEDLCSLNPGLDRFAFSVIWTLDPQGNIINQWIGRTIIRSCAKLSYDDAQIVIDNLTPSANPDDLKQVIAESSIEHLRTKARLEQDSIHDAATIAEKIMWLNLVARQMRARRFVDGALRLNRVKLKFGLDPVTQLPTGFAHYVNKSANELVEEYMLLANMSVAKFIYETFPKGALLRRHPTPHERKLNEFLKLANFLGFDVDASSGGALYQSLLKYPDDVRVLLEELATRSMQTAQYFSTSTVKNPTDTNHYALNVPLYTHFTSPIRRYPDVLVHRICTAALALESSPSQSSRKQQSTPGKNLIRPTELERMAKHSNMRKTLARKAQEQSEHIYLCLWLRDHPFVDEHCNVLEVGERFVKFYSHKLGRAVRVFLGALEDKKVKTKWDADSRTVHLTFPTGSKISLAHLTPVTVKFTVPTNRFPLDIDASLVLDHGVIPLEGSNVSTL